MIDGSQVPIYTHIEGVWPQELSPNRIRETDSNIESSTFSSNPSPNPSLLLSVWQNSHSRQLKHREHWTPCFKQ